MALYSELDKRHRVAFAFVVIGFIICVTGVASPDWIEAGIDPSENALSLKLNAKFGLWTSFIDLDLPGFTKKECHTGVSRDDSYRLHAARFLVQCQLFLSLMGVLLTFIRFASCCTNARTGAVGHGILTFFNAWCGFGAVRSMVLEVKSDMDLGQQRGVTFDFTYIWGFYVYIGGCCTTVIVSAILCFFMPKEAAELPQVFTQQGYAMDGQIQQSKRLPPTHSSHM